jgi:hypothetical protein
MVCNLIVTGSKLVKDDSGKAVDARKYKQIVGFLMYLLATRPDLTYDRLNWDFLELTLIDFGPSIN